MTEFKNRSDAGKRLAAILQDYANRPNAVVLGLPRGGIPVAFEVATKLGLPLDVFVVRKLGVPGHEEFAMGAIASGGIRVLNDDTIRSLNIPREMIESVAEKQGEELKRREQVYRGSRPHLDVRDLTVILVDDGLATGATMRAAVQALRKQKPLSIIVAVPAAAPEACEELGEEADDIICAVTPDPFFSVGSWYEDFSQTTDDEVRQLLKIAHEAEKTMGEKS
jgi:predicted phosphoribosyltransferase